MSRVFVVALATLLVALPAVAQAAPTLSTSDRLPDRRYAAVGTRAYAVGTEDGRWPAMGWHTRGEMGGIWAPPIKLLDGMWFALDGRWLPRATRFTSGWGFVQMDVPTRRAGLRLTRTEVAPDGRRGYLVGLSFESTGAAQSFELWMDAHSELMDVYPWGETNPSQLEVNGPDAVAVRDGRLEFTDEDRAAVVGAAAPGALVGTGPGFRGPQYPAVICPASGPDTPPAPPRCDDTAYGRGAGGRLRWRIEVPAGGRTDVWFAVAGAETGVADARTELEALLADPAALLREKVAEREAIARHTRLSLPDDPLLAQGIEWSKQNLLDSRQEVFDLEIRETNAGRNYPEPEGTLERAAFLGAGWPDYPWLFATDGEYTAFASVAVGQFEPIEEHLRALRDVSLIDNGTSGKVIHEMTHDGSIYFGSLADPGNTDETAKFPSAVALLWRWTGDQAFLEEMYPFARANLEYVFSALDEDGDLWPEGLGNVERPGMGEEKLDNTVYTIRGLYDLADMARARGDAATRRWALQRGRAMRARFDAEWWMPEVPQHADSLREPGNQRVQQRHWIGATPMEVELTEAGRAVPGLTTRERGEAALELRETPCYGDEFGMFHTGRPGCDGAPDSPGELQAFTLNTSIAAVAEGNYGRLGVDQQQRWTFANRRLQLPDPDEQPGAMPEIAPSPLAGRTIDRPLTERPMVLQAWGAYGTAWPVVHQQLGVRPDLGRGRLEVVPQLPEGQQRVAGRDIRLGEDGAVDVIARAADGRWRTRVVLDAELRRLRIGHTLPAETEVRSVRLDGERVEPELRTTNRGLELTVEVRRPGAAHQLVVRTE